MVNACSIRSDSRLVSYNGCLGMMKALVWPVFLWSVGLSIGFIHICSSAGSSQIQRNLIANLMGLKVQ